MVDFANESSEILEAFQTYYQTAQLSEATDPNLILDLKTKLDVQNHYDENEIDRVVGVLLNPNAKQSQLISALEPVAQRLMNTYKEARQKLRDAENYNDPDSGQASQGGTGSSDPVPQGYGDLRALLHVPFSDL